jgi:hypothetical protein
VVPDEVRTLERYARVILPAFMHFVQTLMRFTLPSTTAFTFWMFGRNIRFVTRCEWLTLRPAAGCFPQTVQTLDISYSVPVAYVAPEGPVRERSKSAVILPYAPCRSSRSPNRRQARRGRSSQSDILAVPSGPVSQ